MSSGLEGVKDLTAQLTEMGAKVAARELRGTVKEAMQIAEHVARARMPVGTVAHKTHRGRIVTPGFALQSLHVETKIDKSSGSAVAFLGVSREAFYAVQFVELGTARMPARPWLRPALEESQDPMLRQIADSLRARLERIAKRRKG